jgi:hypothetical protein
MSKKVLIISLVLLGLIGLVFGSIRLINNFDKELKEENERLKKEFNNIQSERDSLKAAREIMKTRFDSIQVIINIEEEKIAELTKALLLSKKNLSNAVSDLNKEKEKIEETDKKIQEINNNPIKREGDQLLKSLNKKLKP